jgi:hypothetical protein
MHGRAREPTSGVKGPAENKFVVQQEQGPFSQIADLDRALPAELEGWVAGGEVIDGLQQMEPEMPVVGRDGVQEIHPEMDLAKLDHCARVGPAKHFDQLQIDLGKALGILMPEFCDDAFDELRRSRNLQCAGLAEP